MQEEFKNYTEEWTLVINKTKYILTEKRARIIQDMIGKGKGGMVRFDDYYINIPFIQEFYLSNKIYNKNIALDNPEYQPISDEQKAKNREKVKEIKEKYSFLK